LEFNKRSFTKPQAQPTSKFDFLTTVPLNAYLDPAFVYLVSITFTNSDCDQYRIATQPPAAGSTGGYMENLDGNWVASAKDLRFGVGTKNLLYIDPDTNSAQGPGPANVHWAASTETSFSAIQVNWANLTVNTAYSGSSTSVLIFATDPTLSTPQFIPYAVAASCQTTSSGAYAYINLTNTPYYVDDSFTPIGYAASGYVVSQSANNQVYELFGGGYCGYEITQTLSNVLNNYDEISDGGWYLQLGRVAGTVPVSCGVGQIACGNTVGGCYDPSAYDCVDGTLCPKGDLNCGGACYDPAAFACEDGALVGLRK